MSEASFESENEGDLPESEDDDDVASTAGDVVTGCRRLPDASTLDCERRLQRIATTGGGCGLGHTCFVFKLFPLSISSNCCHVCLSVGKSCVCF